MIEAHKSGRIPVEGAIGRLAGYVVAAFETTISAISSGMWLFARHPEQWDLLRADPSLVPSAFYEIVRVESPIQVFLRVTTCDVDLGEGVVIPSGARVLHSYGAANRDERHFPDPDRFDVTRNPVDHLAFGYGNHGCAGQGLARLEVHPRDISVGQVAAFLGVAAITLLVPFPLGIATRALILAVTGVGWLGFSNSGAMDSVSRNMAEVAGILTKVMKDLKEEGFPALEKYRYLVGKNISYDEYQVILKYPANLFHWLGIHRRVFQVVEHMTDAEEQNAVRHVYWQCLLKKRLGHDFAVSMGDAHERGRPGSDADNRADEINNRIGLQLAEDVESEEDCLQRAREMWAAGELATREDLETDPT